MTRRLLALAERPLRPATGRIVVLLGGAVCVGFAVLVGLGLLGPRGTGPTRPVASPAQSGVPSAPVPSPMPPDAGRPISSTTDRRPQDPQDRPGSSAHRRAAGELASHRALQHVPWRHGRVLIRLVGARGTKAVLAVVGHTLTADHRGWRFFLRRFHDDGRAYLPRFTTRRAG